jgi:hypothetical protein
MELQKLKLKSTFFIYMLTIRILIDALEATITKIEAVSGSFMKRFLTALKRSLFKTFPISGGLVFCIMTLCTLMLITGCVLNFARVPYYQTVGFNPDSPAIRILFEAIIMLLATVIFTLIHVQRDYKKVRYSLIISKYCTATCVCLNSSFKIQRFVKK